MIIEDSDENYLESFSISITDCIFENNFAFDNGGAIFLSNSLKVSIINADFKSNEATSGGAIYYKDMSKNILKPKSKLSLDLKSQLILQNNTFVNNLAKQFGGAISIKGKLPIFIEGNSFLGNLANKYGNDYASYAIRIRLIVYENNDTNETTFTQIYNSSENNSEFKFQNLSSGKQLSTVLKIQALDHFGQIASIADNT